MKPSSPADYLRQTEQASRHIYVGLDRCWRDYREARSHWSLARIGQQPSQQERVRLLEYLRKAERYFDLKFTEATYCGAILQIAATGIRVFSRNEQVPDSCRSFVADSDTKVLPFCIGPERHGVPLGLIIYAGRNQYNHWDDSPAPITRAVFAALSAAHYTNALADLAFELDNQSITIFANEVLLGALGWQTYEVYEAGMRELLIPSS